MHPLAHSYAYAAALEKDSDDGYIIKTYDDYVFCGFREARGAISFQGMVQHQNSHNPNVDANKVGTPVFMTTDEMEKEGIAAVSFPTTNDAYNFSDIPDEILRHCSVYHAQQDVELPGPAPGPIFAKNGMVVLGREFKNNRTFGLTSAEEAAKADVANLPFSLTAAFGRRLREMVGQDIAPSNVQDYTKPLEGNKPPTFGV